MANDSLRSARAGLLLGALGVVYGDIGTSPLYTLRTCLEAAGPGAGETAVLGSLSLIFWALLLVVCGKYVTVITRADNDGEGGIFALLALLQERAPRGLPRPRLGLGTLATLVGASLLCGEGLITPAISVLSAAEGMEAVRPELHRLVLPVAILILAGLFWLQHQGTAVIGRWFGPVMLVWFLVLGALGLFQIFSHPGILRALNPWYAFAWLRQPDMGVAAVLGGVVLAFTGVEALYADMGHFGRRQIVWAWYGLVLPCLCLNYFGQGALVLSGQAGPNPFFSLAPAGPWRVALVGLSMVATVIASQALISGLFSLVRQAIQLGYCPRLVVEHTSREMEGQIYLPFVNTVLALGCIAVVYEFGSSQNLAAAYGLAVTGTMTMTTVVYFLVLRRVRGWNWGRAAALCGGFLLLDLVFFGANLPKFPDGGWLPFLVGGVVFAIMHTWKVTRAHIAAQLYSVQIPLEEILQDPTFKRMPRVEGTAVFLSANKSATPLALLHHLKCNRSLHRQVVIFTIEIASEPFVRNPERLTSEHIGEKIWRAVARYGYMEEPNLPAMLRRLERGAEGLKINHQNVYYFFNRENIILGGKVPLWRWQKILYKWLVRNSSSARDYFRIPAEQIVEMGLPIQL